jgi:heat shock protein HslJ
MLKTLLALLAVLVLAACSGSSATTGPSDAPPSTSPAAADPAGEWRLTAGSVDGQPLVLPADRAVTFNLEGTSVSGQSACNQYFGEVSVVGGRVTLSGLGGTEMACDEPTMTLEGAYLKGLAAVQAATVADDALLLEGPGVELRFERLVAPPAAELLGTSWVLESLVSGDAVSSTLGEPATLVLGADGSLAGSTGCRPIAGRYTLTGDGVDIEQLAPDGDCDAGTADQDAHVIAVLGDGFTAAVDGQQLTLTAADGRGLVYRVAAAG